MSDARASCKQKLVQRRAFVWWRSRRRVIGACRYTAGDEKYKRVCLVYYYTCGCYVHFKVILKVPVTQANKFKSVN